MAKHLLSFHQILAGPDGKEVIFLAFDDYPLCPQSHLESYPQNSSSADMEANTQHLFSLVTHL